MNKTIRSLTAQEALILQQLSEAGEDQLDHLTIEMHDTPGCLLFRINTLRKKGLVKIISSYGEPIISLTNTGKRTVNYIWPEARLQNKF